MQKINIRAEIRWDEPMALHTSFRIGGPAELFVRPEDASSAVALESAAWAEGIPLFILGGGANILVGGKGIRGIVLDTSRLRSVRIEAADDPAIAILIAGAGLSTDELCLDALAKGLAGLEDFAGMPGSVGGAVFMNARCYEREVSQVLAWALSARAGGCASRHPIAAAEWSYKRSPYQRGGIRADELVLEAAFRLTRMKDATAARVARIMRERLADREAKGHFRLPSAGSVFKNDRRLGAPTGKLLDGLGLRGRRVGDALVSPWHANIFVNSGHAAAADMRALIELAQREALEKLGVELESEVLMVGEF
jgi:UDP-N-acetylmuramate dehydrogenase